MALTALLTALPLTTIIGFVGLALFGVFVVGMAVHAILHPEPPNNPEGEK